MEKIEIAGLGFCSMDYLSILPHIPLDEKVEIEKGLAQGGGPAATATVAAARLGAKTAFLGSIGDDQRGKAILEEFEKEKVNTRYIQVKKDRESPVAYCWVEKTGGKRSIAWSKGTSMPMDVSAIDPLFISSLKILHLDGHHTEAAIKAATLARKYGVTVSLDAGTLVPGVDQLIHLADICIASQPFASRFTGETDPAKAAVKLFGEVKYISAVTCGEEGVYAVTPGGSLRKKAFRIQTVDTTGAGDVFHGAFAYAWLRSWEPDFALDFAAAAAALKCTKLGGRTGIPTLQEVIEFLKMKGVKI